MSLVMNASSEEQQVRVHGAWFTFKPKQIKDMHEDKVFYLTSIASHLGFVGLPETLSDIDFRNSKEGQEIVKEAEKEGIAHRCQYLERLKQNELISLQRDLDQKGLKYDARLEMSPEMVKRLEELVKYKNKKQDAQQAQVDRIKELEKLLEE